MLSELPLRPATLADVDAVYRLICELKHTHFDYPAFKQGFARNLQDPLRFYQLAWQQERAIGLIALHLQFHLHHVSWIGEIQELIVSQESRSEGVGRQLLLWAEATARDKGAEMMELSSGMSRENAHRFYRREGYQLTHARFTKVLSPHV